MRGKKCFRTPSREPSLGLKAFTRGNPAVISVSKRRTAQTTSNTCSFDKASGPNICSLQNELVRLPLSFDEAAGGAHQPQLLLLTSWPSVPLSHFGYDGEFGINGVGDLNFHGLTHKE